MSVLQGNLQGLKPSQLNSLTRLYKRRFVQDVVFSHDQARELALLSRSINRQIGMLIDRRGKVKMVLIGTASSLYIPELPHLPSGRLRGLRFLHTHLTPDGPNQEDLMDMLFLQLDSVVTLTVSPAGDPMQWQPAWISPGKKPDFMLSLKGEVWEPSCFVGSPRPWHDNACDLAACAREIEAVFDGDIHARNFNASSRAILVSVSQAPLSAQETNLTELAELAKTAGIEVGGTLMQRVSRPDPRLILGKGKIAELEVKALNAMADLLIFDGELTPAQLHNLADITERKVLDRTQLILDIFAQHAATRAGKLQVELAQLAYAQPRLTGRNKALDRLAGGIGGRGPGETRLETDRRKSRERMTHLRHELDLLRRQRAHARKRRQRNAIPVAALVGYTNSGKSTLLNVLTSSGVLAADKLFATLDPATRRLRFPREREITIADTVGFIRNLPKELRDAFRATLEELESADLLLHVADASNPHLADQLAAVSGILEELGLAQAPQLLILNKVDRLTGQECLAIREAYPGAILVSALHGAGLDALLSRLEQELFISATGRACNSAALALTEFNGD